MRAPRKLHRERRAARRDAQSIARLLGRPLVHKDTRRLLREAAAERLRCKDDRPGSPLVHPGAAVDSRSRRDQDQAAGNAREGSGRSRDRVGSRVKRIAILTAAAAAALLVARAAAPRRASGPMEQQAYVWQRAWSPPVVLAVRGAGARFAAIVALGAEVTFDTAPGAPVRPRVTNVVLDYSALRGAGRPVGLAIRIGTYPGRFDADAEASALLVRLAEELCAAAWAEGVALSEIQIDFDCPTSKLDGYRLWIEALKPRIAPVPLTFTALPSWLGSPGFERLARAADGYVLQVHALERPAHFNAPLTLCDPRATAVAVERAAELGLPFRVALPTYGYAVAFDQEGRFIGLSAEGPQVSWPEGTRVRQLWADPDTLADLVSRWSASRPPELSGLLWYRLPTDDDAMSFRPATLTAVMRGQRPRRELRAEVRRPEPALSEIALVNAGEADAPAGVRVWIGFEGATLIAADALGGFERGEERADGGRQRLELRSGGGAPPLRPGDRRVIGWVRLSGDKEVSADVAAEL